jgi:Fe-S-cluster containining protein
MAKGPLNGKLRRFGTSLVLPVDSSRKGECMRCGACCRFLVSCPFLRESDVEPGTFKCAAYAIRPLQCRKYPRSKKEQIHQPCGYRFDDSADMK